MADIPLSLYLHFPWCVRKCPYCDFNSHTLRAEIPEQAYVDALLRDLDFELTETPEPRPLQSIFMGGGTPSLFSAEAIGRLLDAIARRLNFAPDIEITLEANPGTAEAGHFPGYRSAGVNRISMGFQSLDDDMLKRLGRIHGRQEALRAFELARRAGFDNINIDLMYALPDQTARQASADLAAAIALAPEHLSYYQLTLEPNTEFGLRPPPLPDDDTAWAMQEGGVERLASAGYRQYEISAYAQAGRKARHNVNYWTFGDYLGIGAGAHAKRSISTASGLNITRRARHKHPRTYMERSGTAASVQEQHAVPEKDRPFEFLMNALRLNRGFEVELYRQHTGTDWNPTDPAVLSAIEQGWLSTSPTHVRATAQGLNYLNALLGLFLNGAPS
ncbi:radical SAM family heme chaperone HemW [Sinimarinibacterium sp. CAU 1509]|uniref:radical SAM family heme chaperone HemW n=1 Tax=Sinimarinibacterium sp. CAU 1509 TaxID=2562283 RepID=UPI0010AD1D51|nr:radical SAM family heme chaperone HemW [Sinimarinibacterium sp. CAU 1509]TJY58347.1 radical SAM family heme chaperone HemW [Sinimarinibacterium sp. CAU 1509]